MTTNPNTPIPSNLDTAPRGYDYDRRETISEAQRVSINDHGQGNVIIGETGYRVSEETRRMPGTNGSLQAVTYSYGGNVGSPARASLESKQGDAISVLTGTGAGDVLLTVYRDGREFSQYITMEAAAVGLTAAGIRRTQKDIAADGEVSRPEQERINTMIDTAKGLAGIR